MSSPKKKAAVDEKRLLDIIGNGAVQTAGPTGDYSLDTPPETPAGREKLRPQCRYERTFLNPKTVVKDRRVVYVSGETFEAMMKILKSIAGRQVSTTQFTENIIAHHIRKYSEEVNRINREIRDTEVFQ